MVTQITGLIFNVSQILVARSRTHTTHIRVHGQFQKFHFRTYGTYLKTSVLLAEMLMKIVESNSRYLLLIYITYRDKENIYFFSYCENLFRYCYRLYLCERMYVPACTSTRGYVYTYHSSTALWLYKYCEQTVCYVDNCIRARIHTRTQARSVASNNLFHSAHQWYVVLFVFPRALPKWFSA